MRVITRPLSFEAMVGTAFHGIRRYGKDDPAVTARLREILTDLLECAGTDEQRAILRREASRSG
jgi:uncharacterized membrane protein